MTSHDFGRATEARFIAEASEMGLMVSRPFAEAPGYDAVVDTGRRLLKVQIKGARSSARSRTYWKVNINPKRGRRRPLRFDVLAVYLGHDNRWIFFTYRQVKDRRQLGIIAGGRWDRMSSSWDIFRKSHNSRVAKRK